MAEKDSLNGLRGVGGGGRRHGPQGGAEFSNVYNLYVSYADKQVLKEEGR